MMEMLNLQQDIQVEILNRLPAKSISVCRCVCKTWYTILCDPKFVDNLLIQANKNPRLMLYKIPYGICKKTIDMVYSIDYASVLTSDERQSNGVVEMDYPFQGEYFASYTVLGSCNGLFCLASVGKARELRIWIWNPTTREYKKTSVPQYVKEQHPNTYSFGFGHDSKTDDYKIVRISGKKDSTDGFKMQVYSLASDSWNCIDNPIPYSFSVRAPYGAIWGLLFHGALYWIAKSHETSLEVIVSFDMGTERLMDVPFLEETNYLPEGCQEAPKHVGVLGDCLCLAVAVKNVRFDVWVMQDYGVGDSWTKKFTIAQDQASEISGSFLKPIRSFENGEILIQTQKNLILYDQTNGRVRMLSGFLEAAIGKRGILMVNGENYVESLVSLKSGTYVEKRTKTVGNSESSFIIFLL